MFANAKSITKNYAYDQHESTNLLYRTPISLICIYQNIDKLRYLLTEGLGSSSVCPVDHQFSNGATDPLGLDDCMELYHW